MKLCLVCSSGGHFSSMRSLKELWSEYERFWVTLPAEDTKFFLRSEKTYRAHYPTRRNLKNLLRNAFLAWKLLRKEKPDVIISTGAGVAVPFIYVGRLLGIRTIYLESWTRVKGLSLSARLVYPVVDVMLVQWPEVAGKYAKAMFKGQVL